MHNHKEKEQRIKNIVRYSTIAIISSILTLPSMIIIKNVPGNTFRTELDYIATALLVLIIWFALLTLCVWLTNYLNNSRKLKNDPADKNAQLTVNKK